MQSEYMTKTKTSLPSLSLEAMMISCTIDANEGQFVFVTSIPRAFLHAYMESDVHMLLEGTIAELIVNLSLAYTENTFGKIKMGNQCYMSN